jgi:hypothetical protein
MPRLPHATTALQHELQEIIIGEIWRIDPDVAPELQRVEYDLAESGPPMPKIEAMIAPQIRQAMWSERVREILASAIEIVGAEHRAAGQEVAAAQARGFVLF